MVIGKKEIENKTVSVRRLGNEKTETFKKLKKKCKEDSKFETELFPIFIKSFNAEFTKLTGFWYSIDNIKDIKAINNKKTLKNKYMNLRKIKNKLLT